ncbi:MAG TPA: CHASE2 domain-containing protein [Burkholderiales bacterium]|nr:CHASE2 domain-containing protein [Burkholderiales bacterium]
MTEAHPRPAASAQALLQAITGSQGRPLGAFVLALMLAFSLYPSLPPMYPLRMALFDGYQKLSPRKRVSAPAVIVAIDEKSLQELGQWPWPRTTIAELIEAIAKNGPAAIGVDVLMPESDRMSPAGIAGLVEKLDPKLAKRLMQLPSNDTLLSDVIRRHPVVLGIAGVEQSHLDAAPPRGAPFRVRGGDPRPQLRFFAGALRSLDILDSAAAGHGLLSVDPTGGVVRRVPLLASVDGVLTPALSMEVLRVGTRTPAFTVVADAQRVKGMGIGDVFVPTNADGTVWVHFGPHDEDRFVSAVDVLRGRIEPEQMRDKIALLGATGLGLLDYQTSAIGQRIPGIEIHAQILEGIFDDSLLQRPEFLEKLERLLILAVGLIVILAVPIVRPRLAAAIYVVLLAGLFAGGFALYYWEQLLLDVAWPAAVCTVVFGVMLGGTLTEADRQRRALRQALQSEREAAARAAGELEAAQRIQMGMLPPPSAQFYRDPRFSLQALIEPAKSVGGDLYDFFKLDGDRLFFMVGDVAGKGLPASIFMAVSKALYKSAALRMESGADVGEVMRAANREIARDNPEMLFVTVFAAILDLRSGDLAWCNAGHDAPLRLRPAQGAPVRLEGDAGPPLCVIEDYAYRTERYRMTAGESLCLFTDGVTEAMNASGELYGRQRLLGALASSADAGEAIQIVDAIRDDVREFVQATERSDDLTILAMRWNGGQA